VPTCSDCGTKIGFLKGLCDPCQTKAQAKFKRDNRDNNYKSYEEMISLFKEKRPDLLKAWENWTRDLGKQDVSTHMKKLKSDQDFEIFELNQQGPTVLEPSIIDPIPVSDKVLAMASGTNKIGNSDYCYWILTDKNVVIVRYGLMRRTEIRGNELVALNQISGFERQQTSRSSNLWEMVITRASNADGILHVEDAVASNMISAYNAAKADLQGSAGSGPRETKDPADAIRKLKGLLDEGLITQEEFDDKRKKLLEEM
jgi:hypothetical protein